MIQHYWNYVWAAYGIASLVLVINIVWAKLTFKRIHKKIVEHASTS